jgi:uncharacterized protein YjbI with pentapeptide repeats
MPIRKTPAQYWKSKGRWKYGVLALIALIALTVLGLFLDIPGVRQCLTSFNLDQCNLLGKTVWDWLDLLGVPLSLAILGYILQRQQQKRSEALAREQRERDQILAKEQREIAADEEKEEILQTYFDRLSTVLIDKNILAIAQKIYISESENKAEKAEIRSQESNHTTDEEELFYAAIDVIRARTLSILRRFKDDRERKSSVVRFLIAAEVISKGKLSLHKASLSRVDLSYAPLISANFSEADLRHADLRSAILINADLRSAILINANLSDANLSDANLLTAKLEDTILISTRFLKANLSMAHLTNANLTISNLSNADLTMTHLRNAILCGVDLTNAKLGGADLSGANLSNANGENGYAIKNTCLFGTDLEGITWDKDTTKWPASEEVARAHNIPEALKQQLGIA